MLLYTLKHEALRSSMSPESCSTCKVQRGWVSATGGMNGDQDCAGGIGLLAATTQHGSGHELCLMVSLEHLIKVEKDVQNLTQGNKVSCTVHKS